MEGDRHLPLDGGLHHPSPPGIVERESLRLRKDLADPAKAGVERALQGIEGAAPAAGWTAANPTNLPGCLAIHSPCQRFWRSQVSWRSQYQPSRTQVATPASSMSAIIASESAHPWIDLLPAGATHAVHPGSPWAAPQPAGSAATSAG